LWIALPTENTNLNVKRNLMSSKYVVGLLSFAYRFFYLSWILKYHIFSVTLFGEEMPGSYLHRTTRDVVL